MCSSDLEENNEIFHQFDEKTKQNKKIIELILKNPLNIEKFNPEQLLNQKELVLKFFKNHPKICRKLSKKFEICEFLKLISSEKTWIHFKNDFFKILILEDFDFVLKMIEKTPKIFGVSKYLHHNEKLLKFAIEIDPNNINFVKNIELKLLLQILDSNPKLIKLLNGNVRAKYQHNTKYEHYRIVEDAYRFQDISPKISTKIQMKEYLRLNGNCMYYAKPIFKKDKELSLIAVNSDGESLEFIDESLYSDRDVILAACKNYGRNLTYASDMLKDDFEIVKVAATNNGTSIKFASKRLKLNVELCLIAIEQTRAAYRDLDISMKTQIDIWLVYTKRYKNLQPNKQEKLKDIQFRFH